MSRRPISEALRRAFNTLDSLRRAKLGRCTRCQRIAGWGAAGAWTVCLLTRLINLPAAYVMLAAGIAAAFTILLAAHTVAFALWMAEAMRKARASAGPQLDVWKPREFALLIARLTLVNLRTSLFSGR